MAMFVWVLVAVFIGVLSWLLLRQGVTPANFIGSLYCMGSAA